jgi:Phospholipase_D-nuclease N-terminal
VLPDIPHEGYDERPMNDTQLVLLLLPILVIEIGLILFALWDLLRPDRRVRGDSKLMWGLIIVFIGMIGPIVYFLVGRDER